MCFPPDYSGAPTRSLTWGRAQGDPGARGVAVQCPPKQHPAPPRVVYAHSPVRQSGFHGAHGVEGGLHGEFPGRVALAALLMSEQQQAAKLLAPGGQQGCKEGQHGQRARDWPLRPAAPGPPRPPRLGAPQAGFAPTLTPVFLPRQWD